MTLKLARVCATHPEDNSLDLVMIDTGGRLAGVQMLSLDASSRSGTVNLPEVAESSDGKWGMQETDDDVIAVVGYIGHQPVVLGFLYPQVNQMTFTDKRLKVERHQSDWYHSVDGQGNAQWVHPSGTYLRFGATPDLDDISGKNFDKSFDASRNKGSRVNFRIGMGGGTATVTITPEGAVNITTQATVDVIADGQVTVKASHVEVDTPDAHFTGDIHADGDVVAGTVSLQHHTHGGVMPGPGSTAEPNA